jgi:hypothetical protein
VNRTRREEHLHPTEFFAVFGLDMSSFRALPTPARNQLLQLHCLFEPPASHPTQRRFSAHGTWLQMKVMESVAPATGAAQLFLQEPVQRWMSAASPLRHAELCLARHFDARTPTGYDIGTAQPFSAKRPFLHRLQDGACS